MVYTLREKNGRETRHINLEGIMNKVSANLKERFSKDDVLTVKEYDTLILFEKYREGEVDKDEVISKVEEIGYKVIGITPIKCGVCRGCMLPKEVDGKIVHDCKNCGARTILRSGSGIETATAMKVLLVDKHDGYATTIELESQELTGEQVEAVVEEIIKKEKEENELWNIESIVYEITKRFEKTEVEYVEGDHGILSIYTIWHTIIYMIYCK